MGNEEDATPFQNYLCELVAESLGSKRFNIIICVSCISMAKQPTNFDLARFRIIGSWSKLAWSRTQADRYWERFPDVASMSRVSAGIPQSCCILLLNTEFRALRSHLS